MSESVHVVTGAFGYTGKYIARRLLAAREKVRTLTGNAGRPNPFGDVVEVRALDFSDPRALVASLRGARVLYNTYWVRFDYGAVSFDKAVAKTRVLFAAAKEAGTERIVHISITNPAADSPFPYFRGKEAIEAALRQSGLSYAILRPTVIFGPEDILINNIAWLLRRFPVFSIAGGGDYRLQPVFAEDVAELAVNAAERAENVVLDAVGPEIFSFEELVRAIHGPVESRARLIHVPSGIHLFLAWALGLAARDVLLTREELGGLTANLLVSRHAATCPTRLSEWLSRNARYLGRKYSSELRRHYATAKGEAVP